MGRESQMKDAMKELESLLKKIGPLGEAVLESFKIMQQPPKTTETNLGINKKQIEVELSPPPPAGGFACCPSGDTEYEEALAKWRKECTAKIVAAVPTGYNLKSYEIKEEKIVKNYANLIVEKS